MHLVASLALDKSCGEDGICTNGQGGRTRIGNSKPIVIPAAVGEVERAFDGIESTRRSRFRNDCRRRICNTSHRNTQLSRTNITGSTDIASKTNLVRTTAPKFDATGTGASTSVAASMKKYGIENGCLAGLESEFSAIGKLDHYL